MQNIFPWSTTEVYNLVNQAVWFSLSILTHRCYELLEEVQNCNYSIHRELPTLWLASLSAHSTLSILSPELETPNSGTPAGDRNPLFPILFPSALSKIASFPTYLPSTRKPQATLLLLRMGLLWLFRVSSSYCSDYSVYFQFLSYTYHKNSFTLPNTAPV